MSDKMPVEKLLLKSGMPACFRHVPAALVGRLGLHDDVTLVDDPSSAAFVLDFATTQAEAEERLRVLAPAIGPKTVAWIGYPKGSRTAGHDLNRDTVAAFARTLGLVAISSVSIDEVWSGIRVRPLKPGE